MQILKITFTVIMLLFFYSSNCQTSYINSKKYNTKKVSLTGYCSTKQKIFLVHNRPSITDDLQLFVPGAFTSKNKDFEIDGLAICFGSVIQNTYNKTLNGFCVIENAKPKIIFNGELSNILKEHIILSKSSLFQQDILIKNSEIIKFPLFENTMNFWRTLAVFNDHFEILENDNMITISAFQNALKEIGVIDAIYLDMGSWSEGAYLNKKNKKINIGKNSTNTKRQTNWIVF